MDGVKKHFIARYKCTMAFGGAAIIIHARCWCFVLCGDNGARCMLFCDIWKLIAQMKITCSRNNRCICDLRLQGGTNADHVRFAAAVDWTFTFKKDRNQKLIRPLAGKFRQQKPTTPEQQNTWSTIAMPSYRWKSSAPFFSKQKTIFIKQKNIERNIERRLCCLEAASREHFQCLGLGLGQDLNMNKMCANTINHDDFSSDEHPNFFASKE